MAPYGILQSLLSERDLKSDARGGGPRGRSPTGCSGWNSWPTCRHGENTASGSACAAAAARAARKSRLLESVRQDKAKGLTIFDQEFVERRGRAVRRHSFALTFRTLSVPQMTKRLEAAGFQVEMVLGDYQGGPWDPRAEVWIIMARKVC